MSETWIQTHIIFKHLWARVPLSSIEGEFFRKGTQFQMTSKGLLGDLKRFLIRYSSKIRISLQNALENGKME